MPRRIRRRGGLRRTRAEPDGAGAHKLDRIEGLVPQRKCRGREAGRIFAQLRRDDVGVAVAYHSLQRGGAVHGRVVDPRSAIQQQRDDVRVAT